MAAPYASPPWDAIPRDPAMQSVNDVTLAQSAATLAVLLDEDKDDQILKDACLGLCQLFGEGIQNDRIQAILEADVVPRLVALLKPSKSRNVSVSVQSAALQVIGNVACGDDRQTQVIIDCDALPCLKALLSSNDRGIRKEVCWISSNITESSHQVQAVLDAGILPPLLKLLDLQDTACREDATWVLYNISSNHDMRQISYLAEQNGIRALCNLLTCSKDLDVLWKGCETVAAVALKGLRNILVAGQQEASTDPNGYNRMAALVAEAHGVERIEALTNHPKTDVRQRARLLLERFFGAEQPPTSPDGYLLPDDYTSRSILSEGGAAAVVTSASNLAENPVRVASAHFHDSDMGAVAATAMSDPAFGAAAAGASGASCSCPHPHDYFGGDTSHQLSMLGSSANCETDTAAAVRAHYRASAVVAAAAAATGYNPHAFQQGVMDPLMAMSSHGAGLPQLGSRLLHGVDVEGPSPTGFSSASSTDSDPEDDDSDSDLLPPPPAPCKCLLCLDATPLADRKSRKVSTDVANGSSSMPYGSSGSMPTDLEVSSKTSSGKGAVPGTLRSAVGRDDADPASSVPGAAALKSPQQNPGKRAFTEDGGHPSSPADREMDLSELPSAESTRSLCDFCSGGGRFGDGRAGLAAKLGRAVRLGHSHCVAILLSRMTWSQRLAATEAPALLHPGSGPPDGGVSSSLPAVVLAAHLGKPECLALLLRRCRPDLDVTHGKKRLTPLAWAAHKGYYRCCLLLIEHGANTAAKCGEGLTALHLAASGGGHLSICKLLLDRNAPVNARSSKKQTPLCLATQKGYSKLVRVLLEHSADYNNEDEGRFTPLHIAASNGFSESAEELIKAGSRIDCKTRTGITPLHYAVQGGHTGVVRLLVAAGAKVNCAWKPLLIIAADDGNREVVQILLDALAAIDCRANIKAMLDKDTEIHDKLTPLHLASSKGHKDVVELLLRRGASVDAPTEREGWTALDFAVLNGHAVCAMLLLEYGATVTENAKNAGQTGWTLVQHAAHNGHKDLVRMLIQRLQVQKMKFKNGIISDASSHVTAPDGVPSKAGSDHPGTYFPNAPSGTGVNRLVNQITHSPPSPLSLSSTVAAVPNNSAPIAVLNGRPPSDDPSAKFCASESEQPRVQSHPGIHSSSVGDLNRRGIVGGDVGPSAVNYGSIANSASSRSSYHGTLSANKYDPRAPEGDESCFIPGQQSQGRTEGNGYVLPYAEGDTEELVGASNSGPGSRGIARRRVAKEDRGASSRQRERERKRREAEANEARERLEEAMAQRSVTKLSEAIAHVSKLVLHLATSVGADGSSQAGMPSGMTGDVLEDAYSMPLNSSDSFGIGGGSPGLSNSSLSSSGALSLEVGLGNEVQKARKILAGLQAEERRTKEERAREAEELKRESSQQLVLKAMSAVLEGGDVRALTRTVNRAKRIILDDDDPMVSEAVTLCALIGDAERADATLRLAVCGDDIDSLRSAIESVRKAVAALSDVKGARAASRAFGGKDPGEVLKQAEEVYSGLVKQRDNAVAEQEAAKAQQDAAIGALASSLESGELHMIEKALEKASTLLVSKESAASETIEAAKKVFAKSLKSERRKLRQANSTKDISTINAAVEAASALEVSSLRPDLEASIALSARLREQDAVRSELNVAISSGDEEAIRAIRSRLDVLGMFAEAEAARAELDNLQRVARARSLLLIAIQDAQEIIDSFRAEGSVSEKLKWTWPDGQRLCDLTKRSRGKFNGLLDELCDEADKVSTKLAVVGREALSRSVTEGDTRELAAAIAGYQKSFVHVDTPAMFNQEAGRDLLTKAIERLAALQAKEQEKVRAESAQVKTEYVLANSRRSTVRGRGPRRARTVSQLAKTESVASTNSSECGDDDGGESEAAAPLAGADSSMKGSFAGPRTNVPVATSQVGNAESDCSHFYLWKEGAFVQCGRCGNIRESVNAEWLQRVKKRGSKMPAEIVVHGDSVQSGSVSARAAGPNGCSGQGSGSGLPTGSHPGRMRTAAYPNSAGGITMQGDRHTTRTGTGVRNPGSFAAVPANAGMGFSLDSGQSGRALPDRIAASGAAPVSGVGGMAPGRYMISMRDGMYRGQHAGPMPRSNHGLPTMLLAGGAVDMSSNMTKGAGYQGRSGHSGDLHVGKQHGSSGVRPMVFVGADGNDYETGHAGAGVARREASRDHSNGSGILRTQSDGNIGLLAGNTAHGVVLDEGGGGSADLGMDFANENFGFDIDSLLINDGDK